jgi:hypothetical protein
MLTHKMSAAMKLSLADAALWCSLQKLAVSLPEGPEMVRRRQLWRESNELFRNVYANYSSRPRSWRPESHPDHERAMKLLREADPNSLVQLDKQLRSPELEPSEQLGYPHSEEKYRDTIGRLIKKRADILRAQPDLPPADRSAGKLLLYFPVENLACGAARQSSNGFFTDDNAPPWDTWVDYTDGTLTSWVPEILIPLAEAGIDANPEQCIRWA